MGLNINKRATTDELVIGERKFMLTKFDPLLGNYILLKLTTMAIPMGLGAIIGKGMGAEHALSSEGKTMMSKAEFLELQRDILSCCSEKLTGNNAPIIRGDGTYGISDFTMDIALQLLIAQIAFNFASFFEELGLSSDSTET